MNHLGNITTHNTVLAATSALMVDGTFFGDLSSSIYNAADKPPNTTDVGYFVMLDGTMGRRVVLAFGYAADSGHRYVGTRDIYNSEWLNDWRELAPAIPPQEYSLPLAAEINPITPCNYRKNQFSEVFVGGSVGGLMEDGAVIATLPEGFRPKQTVERPATFAVSGAQAAGSVTIMPDGNISVHGQSAATGVVFAVDFVASD